MRNLILLCTLSFAAAQAYALPVKRTVLPDTSAGYIKVYVQPNIDKATDLLFVVDNSGSMMTHQQNLAANIPVLAQAIGERGIALNGAVLTADMDGLLNANLDKGRFRAILHSTEADFSSRLAQAMNIGTDGSGYEQHFAAIKAALSSPLLENANAGFLREEAHLSVVFLTDAEDQSGLTAAEMKQFLTELKGSAGVSMYSFMSPQAESACQKDDPNQPDKIETLVKEMGGEVFSLCAPDWHAPMISIGDKMAKEIMRTIKLPTEPVLSTVEVRFGSHKLIGGDLRRGWVYDDTANAIVIGELFDFNSQPAGTELEIKFVPKYWQ